MYKKNIISIIILILVAIYVLFFTDYVKDTVNTDDQNVKTITKLPNARFSLNGKVKLSDGDSLQFGSKAKRARLFGIDSPELAQKCKKNGENWKCGEAAKFALKNKIGNQKITCIGDEKDKYGRLIATCYLLVAQQNTYQNLNAWMVKNGWAIAYRYYSKRYIQQEAFAKKKSLGIWQGTFEEPFKWRQKNNRN